MNFPKTDPVPNLEKLLPDLSATETLDLVLSNKDIANFDNIRINRLFLTSPQSQAP